jgi:hypothetical protein
MEKKIVPFTSKNLDECAQLYVSVFGSLCLIRLFIVNR